MRSHRVLIVGSGYVGSALGVRLSAEGHLVWALRRSVEALPASVKRVEADLRVPNTLRHTPDVDFVVFLANAEGEDLRPTLVKGLGALLASMHAQKIRPKRVLLGSCLSVYGHTDGRWIDEDSEVAPSSERAKALRDMERVLADAPFRGTAVRFGHLYGPNRVPLLDRVSRASPFLKGDLTTWVNPIHRDDCVGVLRHLMLQKHREPLYVATDGAPATTMDIARWLAGRMDLAEPALSGAEEEGEPRTNVRAMNERLLESGYTFLHRDYTRGYRGILTRRRR